MTKAALLCGLLAGAWAIGQGTLAFTSTLIGFVVGLNFDALLNEYLRRQDKELISLLTEYKRLAQIRIDKLEEQVRNGS